MDTGPHPQVLSRAQSSLIRQLLREKHVRSREGVFVVEGAKPCHDLISHHPQAIQSLLVSPHYLRAETSVDRSRRVNLEAQQFVCSDPAFEKLTDVEMPQGILAVVQQPQWDEAQVLGQSRVLGVYGDRLQDPANVGAIIRTAAALNLSAVWLSHDSADHFSPKVVRATAGTLLELPIFRTTDLRTVTLSECRIYSAVLSSTDRVPIREIRTVPSRLLVAVGNEGAGLSSEIMKASQIRFSIPLAEGVESLNVAATVAISAFYFSGLPIDSAAPRRKPPQSV
ncbi:TrmH family RNA methyltransferase [Nitrospira sp. BLG_1]|uniref:TrmH family RNA methyltransferase n=1 Tax=Nitrospira sp. BLG_1 TaxID=3395883 RepID=UPI0039BC3046